MSFWDTISSPFRMLTTSWSSIQEDEVPVSAAKRTKVSDIGWVPNFHKSSSLKTTTKNSSALLQIVKGSQATNSSCPKLNPVSSNPNGKRSLEVHPMKLPLGSSSADVEQLIANMGTFRLSSVDDIRVKNATTRQEILDVMNDTRHCVDTMKPEIELLTEKLKKYDPCNSMLFTARDVVQKVESLAQGKGIFNRPSRSKNSHNEKGSKAMLQDSLWKAQQRNILVRRHLQVIIDNLHPLLKEYEQRQILQNNLILTTKVCNFLSMDDLIQCTCVCKNMNTSIYRHNLILGNITSIDLRRKLWSKSINQQYDLKNQTQKKFKYYDFIKHISTSKQIKHSLIDRDVKRTTFFRTDDIYAKRNEQSHRLGDFNRSKEVELDEERLQKRQDQLCRIVKGYCLYDNNVGYCQGMTHICALILSSLEYHEEDTFKVFVAMMDIYEMNDIFRNGLPGTLLRNYQLQRLLNQYLPDLSIALNRCQIQPLMFSSGWIMTLFTNCNNLSPSIMIRIFDHFIKEGWCGFFKFILGLLCEYKNQLLEDQSTNKMLQAFNQLTKQLTHDHMDSIFARSKELPFTNEDLAVYSTDYKRMP